MKIYFFLIFVLCLGVVSCASDEDDKKGKNTSAPVISGKAPEPSASELAQTRPSTVNEEVVRAGAEQQMSPAEQAEADAALAFGNQAHENFAKGYYALPELLFENSLRYLETWHLPVKPKIPRRKPAARRLEPPAGIFNDGEMKLLASSFQEMDSALSGMLADYRALEKYLANDKIKDDGKIGKELSRKLAEGRARFMKARESWLEIVDNRAAKAEAAILRSHPLQRQILAARNIFARINEVAQNLKIEAPVVENIVALRDSIAAMEKEAGKPPFPASPAIERCYRLFLGGIREYVSILDRAVLEGFHGLQKKEINQAAKNCRLAYNEFVRAVNRLASL